MRDLSALAAGAAFIVILTITAPAQSATPLQCSGAVTGVSATEDDAEQQWSNQVASQLGNDWSDFSLAKNKSYSETDLHLGNAQLWAVSAQPCRHAVIIRPITNLGGMFHSPDPGKPKPVFPTGVHRGKQFGGMSGKSSQRSGAGTTLF
jgi:hypothetical protein